MLNQLSNTHRMKNWLTLFAHSLIHPRNIYGLTSMIYFLPLVKCLLSCSKMTKGKTDISKKFKLWININKWLLIHTNNYIDNSYISIISNPELTDILID